MVKTFIIAYLCAGIAFLIIDAIWLSTMADILYRPLLGDKLAEPFNLAPAVVFYLLYIFGIVFIAILPALEAGDWRKALINGAVLGLVAYGTYDLTNQATLKDWPTIITVADLAWGTFLTATAATLGYLGVSRFA